MKLLSILSNLSLPPFLKKIGLNRLSKASAAAFETTAPSCKGKSYEAGLQKYALFTRDEVEKAALSEEELPKIQARLYKSGYKFGKRLRQLLHLNNLEEVMTVSRILYQTLEIDFQGNKNGEITIERCFFSKFYTPKTCEVISALDQGILEGLAGEGRLQFYQRITEGDGYCKACLLLKGKAL